MPVILSRPCANPNHALFKYYLIPISSCPPLRPYLIPSNDPLTTRDGEQRLLLAAKNLSMLCVPEGGMSYDWDLTYIIDGLRSLLL